MNEATKTNGGKKVNEEKIIGRFEYLSKLIHKYAHRWGAEPSNRLCGWVDEYNNLRSEHRFGAFRKYCERHGFDESHNGHDSLA